MFQAPADLPVSEQIAELRARAADIVTYITRSASYVQRQHRAVAGEVFDAVGPIGEPVEIVHDTISDAVYDIIRDLTKMVGRAIEGQPRKW
ncbi:hypothetical protein [Nocardia sp. NPDC052566]|uniref:hypothetical protein n=1 Tax=Nocardia sp. NPDC052566 TaxID=3364330 RepID=UPI0037CCAA93